MNAHTRAEALRLLDEMDKQDALEAPEARTAYYEASEKLRAILSASDDVPDGWRTMESAPRDGTWFIVWPKDHVRPAMARWFDAAANNWLVAGYDLDGPIGGLVDARWMPSPPPPNGETK